MVHPITLGVALFVLWLLLSGLFQGLPLFQGIASSALVAYLATRMGIASRQSSGALLYPWRCLEYVPWLAWEVIKANIDVSRRILAPSLPISPTVRAVKSNQVSDLGRVIFANSITLTPGTISIDLEDGWVQVHALSREAADELEAGEMNRRACGLEKPR